MQEAVRFLRVPEGTLRYWRADLVPWLTEQTNRAAATTGSAGHRLDPCRE